MFNWLAPGKKSNKTKFTYDSVTEILEWLQLATSELGHFLVASFEKLDIVRLFFLPLKATIVATLTILILIEDFKLEDRVPPPRKWLSSLDVQRWAFCLCATAPAIFRTCALLRRFWRGYTAVCLCHSRNILVCFRLPSLVWDLDLRANDLAKTELVILLLRGGPIMSVRKDRLAPDWKVNLLPDVLLPVRQQIDVTIRLILLCLHFAS